LRGSKFAFAPSIRIKLNRVYVPKVFGSTLGRPLGVPTFEWRVYLNMLLQILVLYVDLKDTQHGFRPHRGTVTAWKDIYKYVLPSENIYEIDLKGCFPSISLPLLKNVLMKRHSLPFEVARFYESMNYSIPKLPKEANELSKTVNENQYTQLEEGIKRNIVGTDIVYPRKSYDYPGLPWPSLIEFNQSTYFAENVNTLNQLSPLPRVETGLSRDMLLNFCQTLEVVDERRTMFIHLKHYINGTNPKDEVLIPIDTVETLKFIGTIQGSPLSPYLSAIVIDEIDAQLPKGVGVVKYADDMVFYGPNLKSFVEGGSLEFTLNQCGLTQNHEKSGWIKLENQWLKPLKFLGLTYDGTIKLLKASTRKGSTLIYNKQALINNLRDLKEIQSLSYEAIYNLIDKYLKKGLKLVKLFGTMDTYYVKDVLAYNLSHHYRELREYKDASNNNLFLMKLLIFLRAIFSLPRNILFSLELKRLISMKDKSEAKKFLKHLFKEDGTNRIPLAEDVLTPESDGPRLLPFHHLLQGAHHKQAPYLSEREGGIYSSLPQVEFKVENGILTWIETSWQSIVQRFKYITDNDNYKTHSPNVNFSDMTLTPVENVVHTNEAGREISIPTSFSFNYPLHFLRTLFFTEYNNAYLSNYRNKYTFKNLFESELLGLIISRLYDGKWALGNIVQDFKLKYRLKSMASVLINKHKDVNVFTGSSYAIYYYSRMLKRRSKITTKKH
jgi:hypothetical protein